MLAGRRCGLSFHAHGRKQGWRLTFLFVVGTANSDPSPRGEHLTLTIVVGPLHAGTPQGGKDCAKQRAHILHHRIHQVLVQGSERNGQACGVLGALLEPAHQLVDLYHGGRANASGQAFFLSGSARVSSVHSVLNSRSKRR